ncbi:hypothetical protein D9M71_525340 [compost metagenome]
MRLQRREFFGGDGLLGQQQARACIQVVAALLQQSPGAAIGFFEQTADSEVDLARGLLRVVLALLTQQRVTQIAGLLALKDRLAQYRAHAEAGDQLAGDIGGAPEVVGGPRGDLAEHKVLGGAPGHQHDKAVTQHLRADQVAVIGRPLQGVAQ